MRDPDAKHRESWALLLNAAATPRNGRTQELASALHRLYRCLLAPSKLLGTFIRKESHRRDGMLPFVRVPVEAMDRHSGSNSSGPTGTFSSAPGWWQGNDYESS